MADPNLTPGLVLDVRVGESFVLNADDESRRVVVSIESKDGQRVRARVQSRSGVKVSPLQKNFSKASRGA